MPGEGPSYESVLVCPVMKLNFDPADDIEVLSACFKARPMLLYLVTYMKAEICTC